MQICVACVSDIQGEGGGRARAGLFPYGGASYKPWIVKSVTGSMCTRAANCKSQGLCNEPWTHAWNRPAHCEPPPQKKKKKKRGEKTGKKTHKKRNAGSNYGYEAMELYSNDASLLLPKPVIDTAQYPKRYVQGDPILNTEGSVSLLWLFLGMLQQNIWTVYVLMIPPPSSENEADQKRQPGSTACVFNHDTVYQSINQDSCSDVIVRTHCWSPKPSPYFFFGCWFFLHRKKKKEKKKKVIKFPHKAS